MSDKNQTAPAEVTVSAAEAAAAATALAEEVPLMDSDRTMYLYIVPGESGRFTVRKASGKTATDHAEKGETVEGRPLIFQPSAKVERYTLTVGTVREWLAAENATARAAILTAAGAVAKVTASKVTPARSIVDAWADFGREIDTDAGSPAMRALLADGILCIPGRVGESATRSTAPDTTDATLDAYFGAVPAVESSDTPAA